MSMPIPPSNLSRTDVGRHSVIQGSCIDFMASLTDGSIDVVVTSPPYNLGVAYGAYQDRRSEEDYLKWMHDVACGLVRVLKEDGHIFLNISGSLVKPWVPFDVAAVFRPLLHLQNHIVWVKSISIGDVTSGHFKPIGGHRFLNHNHEHVFHFTKSGSAPLDRLSVGVPFMDKGNIARRGHGADKRCAGNTWFIPYETVQSKTQKFSHPAGFPVGLPERCLRLVKVNSDTKVFDPFLGTGTTIIAAHRCGAIGMGTDIDPVYCNTAVSRISLAIQS